MKKFYKYFLIIFIYLMLTETIFRLIANLGIFNYSYFRIFLSTFVISTFFSFIFCLFKEKVSKILTILLLFVVSFYSILQLTIKSFIGVYISFNVTSQAQAITDYIIDYILCIKPICYLVLVPFVLLIVYFIFFNKIFVFCDKLVKKDLFLISFINIFIIIIFVLTLNLSFMQDKNQLVSTEELFFKPENSSIAIKEFGTNLYAVLDLRNTLFQSEDSDDLKQIDDYINSKNKQEVNEYTNYFEGKNLIIIMMESVNDIFINKDYYPNFYKLYSEGWYFENNYSPRNTCSTGNNEFSGMTGLYSSQTGCTTNIYENNRYNTSIFNLFNDKGYETSSFHDYTDKYYNRHTFHLNMGSNKYYGVEELNLEYEDKYGKWPSDEDMMKEILKIYEGKSEPFMSWITTVSSHQPYKKVDSFTLDYQDMIKENYSFKIKGYMSKLKVLDNSLGTLMNGLKKQGKLDDTVFVLFSDHYPYGISTRNISEVLNYDLGDEEIEKTPFIIYNSKIKSKVFEQYTSYINIVPTIANLFGLNYNEQNYVGNDLLSNNYQSRVVFQDGSWKNEYAYYNSNSGNIKYYGDKRYFNNELSIINKSIQKDIDMSRLIIKSNYFSK